MMQTPVTGTPFSVCPDDGGLHVGMGLGGTGVYEQPPPLQLPGDSWQKSGGLVQSLLVQQFAVGMQLPAQTLSPTGHAQPAAEQTSPPAHGIAPLHVHVPPLQVFVVVEVQSPFEQQLVEGMHDVPQSR